MREPLKESLASASGSQLGVDAQAESNRLVFSISGPAFSDSEEFDVVDVRAARAGARKLMASAIRVFGKAEGSDSE